MPNAVISIIQIYVPGWWQRIQSFVQITPKVAGNLKLWAGQDQTMNSQQFSLSHRKSASRPYASKPRGCLFVFLSFPRHKWFGCTCSCLLWTQGHCEHVYKWTSLAGMLQRPVQLPDFCIAAKSTRSWPQRSPVCLSTLQLSQMCSAALTVCKELTRSRGWAAFLSGLPLLPFHKDFRQLYHCLHFLYCNALMCIFG